MLKEDHRKFDDMLDNIQQAQPSDRKHIFTIFHDALTTHFNAEEKHFYNRMATTDETKAVILEEHKITAKLAKELAKEPATTDEWKAKLTVFHDSLLHYLKDEEHTLFKKAKKVLTKEALDEIAQQIHAYKAEKGPTLFYEYFTIQDMPAKGRA